jgi:hypothetical protein
MRKVIAFLLLAVGYALACPINVSCPVDGMAMFQAGCDYNYQTHKQVCRYEHKHYENGGEVTHYQYVQCE